MSDQMTITFAASVVHVKRFTTKAGKGFCVFTLERQAVFRDVVTTEQYEVTAFGERTHAAQVGDIVTASVRVGSRMIKGRFWPTFTLIGATRTGSGTETAPGSFTEPKVFSCRSHDALSVPCH
jgi:hypothetical protein